MLRMPVVVGLLCGVRRVLRVAGCAARLGPLRLMVGWMLCQRDGVFERAAFLMPPG